MAHDFAFRIDTTRFDEDYSPSEASRLTTNFANLARGEHRRQNLRNALDMIERRVNDLAGGHDANGDRYGVELEIVSAELLLSGGGADREFPLIEVLDVTIVDRRTGERHAGIVGNNFSSYVRDYDFSVVLPAAKEAAGAPTIPDDFGELHGRLFERFLESAAYRERFAQPPVVCISVSTSRTYRRTGTTHPVLGVEYEQDALSATDDYFGRMGLRVRNFMPPGGVAPLALYFRGDLLADYSDLQLAGTIGVMETFQRIYRPEIYNAGTAAGKVFRPSLEHDDWSRTEIGYDREERSRLAVTQGRYTAEHLMGPHGDALAQWAAERPVLAR
ncbi:putative oxygenase MesX [Amnibacterium endophyticum]|uniref:Oxygenase MesX n=1 Tax=Amnibacterium endophyticum TaxID=2109337 RepID=A0ABW4L8T6_9MICO